MLLNSDQPASFPRTHRVLANKDKVIRILIATDAWRPQVNGVVRTLEGLSREVWRYGVELIFLAPDRFRTVGMPTYPEIRLAIATPGAVARHIDAINPDAIHVATEGPIGFLTRNYARGRRRRFTTCYHTRYPEYIAARAPVPLSLSYDVLRRFHAPASGTLVASHTLRGELAARGFGNLRVWRRGVDTALFASGIRQELSFSQRPIFLSVGRIAVEKNLEAFLDLELPGSKIVVGDGPARPFLQRRYPDVKFLGARRGSELADLYASADVCVFPSRTETFGLVMLEALAAGTPVAAFPIAVARELLTGGCSGVLDVDLQKAAITALDLDRGACRRFAATRTMAASARSFLENLAFASEIDLLADRLGSDVANLRAEKPEFLSPRHTIVTCEP